MPGRELLSVSESVRGLLCISRKKLEETQQGRMNVRSASWTYVVHPPVSQLRVEVFKQAIEAADSLIWPDTSIAADESLSSSGITKAHV